MNLHIVGFQVTAPCLFWRWWKRIGENFGRQGGMTESGGGMVLRISDSENHGQLAFLVHILGILDAHTGQAMPLLSEVLCSDLSSKANDWVIPQVWPRYLSIMTCFYSFGTSCNCFFV
jgi:hypothetical protein